MNGNLEGKRKLIGILGLGAFNLFALAVGLIDIDTFEKLTTPLGGLFVAGNVLGDHGMKSLNNFLEFMVKRIEAGK